jgi:hypothetical protein
LTIEGTTGYVGIGTTDPDEKLHVEGDVLIDAFGAGNGSGLFFREGYTDTNKYNIAILAFDDGDASADALDIAAYDGINFLTGSNNRNPQMVIETGGDVGIGVIDPREKLDVTGNIITDWNDRSFGTWYLTGSDYRLGFDTDTTTRTTNIHAYAADAAQEITFSTGTVASPSEKMRIFSDGNVSIGTTESLAQLHVDDGGTGATPSDLLTLQTSYSSNSAQKALTWRDASQIVGQIDTRYDGTSVNMGIGHLYNSGPQTSDIMLIKGTGIVEFEGDINLTGSGDNLYFGNSGNYLSSWPSGSYGSIQVNAAGKGGWEGYSIDGRVNFMHDGGTSAGIYDDVNNQWMFQGALGGATTMRYAGTAKVTTSSGGATIAGDLAVSGGDVTGLQRLDLSDNGAVSPILNIAADDSGPWGIQFDRDDLGAGTEVKMYQSAADTLTFDGDDSITGLSGVTATTFTGALSGTATNSNACSGDSVCETVGLTVSTGTISDTDTAYVTIADGLYVNTGILYSEGKIEARGLIDLRDTADYIYSSGGSTVRIADSLNLDGDLDVAGGDITSFVNASSDTDSTQPSIMLDSTGSGGNCAAQGAIIGIGEQASTSGAAALYMTYVGTGYSQISHI